MRIQHCSFSQNNYLIRVLSPYGCYPKDSIFHSHSCYIADEDISFCLIKSDSKVEDSIYSEVQWLYLEEIRLLSSILLSENREFRHSQFYPYPFGIPIFIDEYTKFEIQKNKDLIKGIIQAELTKPEYFNPDYDVPVKNIFQGAQDIVLPTLISGKEYTFCDPDFNNDLSLEIYNNFDFENYLMIRGLGVLIKVEMMQQHYQFREEAITTLFIAMEVSFKLVIEKLKEKGIDKPTSKEAMDYIHDAFHNIQKSEGYFKDYYERRIMTIHPDSRYGVFPSAPLPQDDLRWLYRDLIEVFTFLISGFVHPKHKEKQKYANKA